MRALGSSSAYINSTLTSTCVWAGMFASVLVILYWVVYARLGPLARILLKYTDECARSNEVVVGAYVRECHSYMRVCAYFLS